MSSSLEPQQFDDLPPVSRFKMSKYFSKSSLHKKDLKRKAESPSLVLGNRKTKMAKIPALKTLGHLVNKEALVNHIQLEYSETVKTDFLKKSHDDLNLLPTKNNNVRSVDEFISSPAFIKDVKMVANGTGYGIRQMIETDDNALPRIDLNSVLSEQLKLEYGIMFPHHVALHILHRLENEMLYMKSEEAKIRVFGKWLNIPRKQASFCDPGLSYTFSGATVKAQPWTPLTKELLDIVKDVTKVDFNFVLVNRYKDGRDHIGEHRDDEVDLDHSAPIASLSFGASRDFVLRHKDFRKNKSKCPILPVTLPLESGSLLVMHPPTNKIWYHSLPVRKRCLLPRVNLTFRKIVKRNV